MRYLIAVALFAFTAFSCSNNNAGVKGSVPDISKISDDTVNYTNIKWLDSVQNLGVLDVGQKVQIKFRFQNSGNKPLYIIAAIPGCGCTVADYPKEPITSGKEGVIVAEFDTNKGGGIGGFQKNIIITSNTKPSPRHVLYFSGEIKKKDGENNGKM